MAEGPDVLIAGAGPAGAVAATILARAGARVRVVDRARFPRHKLCGDSLNPGTLAVLERLGLAAAADGLPIDGMIVTSLPDVIVEGRYGAARGRTVTRAEFDHRLVLAAAAAGAEIDEGLLVEGPIVEDGQVRGLTIQGRTGRPLAACARIVIAADGRYSRIARALKLSRSARHPRRWAIGGYFEGVAGLTSCGEMHIRSDRYIGVAPLAGGLANACLVTGDRAALRQPSDLLRQALESDPLLADRFATARMIAAPTCLGPLAVDCGTPGMPGLLLAGDAAGFVDPMTGDGLHFAIRGAELAAAETVHALEHGTGGAHLRLAAARRRAFTSKVRFNRGLRALVGSPAAIRAAGIGASIAPSVLLHVIRYAGDLQAV